MGFDPGAAAKGAALPVATVLDFNAALLERLQKKERRRVQGAAGRQRAEVKACWQ